MKKRFLFILFFTSSVVGLLAQEQPPVEFKIPRALIKISPLQLFNNTLELGIESFNAEFSKSFQANANLLQSHLKFNQPKLTVVITNFLLQ